jgi:hypothetical protein
MDFGGDRMTRRDSPIQVRAAHLKDVLAAIDHRGPVLVKALEAGCPEMLAEIRGAARTQWLPLVLSLDLNRSLDRAIGREATRALYLEACLASFKTGTLGPLFASALRLFGPSPHLVSKFIPLAWSAVWRGCGELEVEHATKGLVRIAHRDLPRDAVDDVFQDVCAVSIGSIIVGCGKRGQGVVERGRGSDAVRYLLRWEEA